MKVILTENMEKLGQAGEVKEVANGYARNYLFPRNLAIPATKGAMQDMENRRTTATRRASAQVNAAQGQADRLRGLTVLLYARTGEQNRLYGSITSADVAEALRVQHGQTVDRRRIKIDAPIHRTGTFTATVSVGQNLTAPLTLVVAPETTRGAGLTSVAPAAPAPPPPPVVEAAAVTEVPTLDEAPTLDEPPALEGPETVAAVTTAGPPATDVPPPAEGPPPTALPEAIETPTALEAATPVETPDLADVPETAAMPALADVPETAVAATATAAPEAPDAPAAETPTVGALVAAAEHAGPVTFAPAAVETQVPPAAETVTRPEGL